MLVARTTVGVERDLPDHRLRSGHVAVGPTGVADASAAEQRVVEVGVELGLLRVGSAFDFDSAEPLVPGGERLAPHAIEVPVRQFGFQIEPRVFDAAVRYRDLQVQRVAGLGPVAKRDATGAPVVRDVRKDLVLSPCVERVEGTINLDDEEPMID